MDIECKLHRDGGTQVTIDTTTYHFAPLSNGAHVAAVDIEAHADRFLSISEAYRLYRGDGQLAAPSKDAAPANAPEPEPDSPAKLEGDVDGDGDVDDADERATLAAQYEQKFGKKPHYALGIAKLRKALAE